MATATPDSIPRAPPLPAPPLRRARDAAYRFIYPGHPSHSSSAQGGQDEDRIVLGGFSRVSPGLSQNATASHKTGLEINTIAINESGTHALLGGKEIFKTVRVEDRKCTEDLNLRTAIRSRPTDASGQPKQRAAVDIHDVAWAKGDCGDFVAAATSSGKIILYNLGRAGLPPVQLYEHFRQVHKVTFNPHRGNLLLSGSQDGTVKLWDLRDVQKGPSSTLQSKRKYSGQSDGVRDVKWSPTEGVDFAFGTDSGWVQRWDMRNFKTAKVKIPAHGMTCTAIDWHPDGKHLVSASAEKTVRVWDFSSGNRRQKSWEIKTPYPVLNARWRPSCESSMPHDRGARQCTQLVTAYDRDHPFIHIWDFRRPALPFREMVCYNTAPTDLLWHSQDLLWTVGREGIFVQSDIQHAPKVIEKRNMQAFAVSPTGDVNFVTQKRSSRRMAKRRGPPSLPSKTSSGLSQQSSPEHAVLSRSWADDSLDESFLSVHPLKTRNTSAAHSRTSSISHTPPIHYAGTVATVKLDDILLNRKSFRPHQAACRGALPTVLDPHVFAYFAQRYNFRTLTDGATKEALHSVERAFHQNAVFAEKAGQYRNGQSWSIIGFVVIRHLNHRVEKKKCRRYDDELRKAKPLPGLSLAERAKRMLDEHTTSPKQSPSSLRPVSMISRQLAAPEVPESTSNVPTPLARPVADSSMPAQSAYAALPDPDHENDLLLPPILASKHPETVRQPERQVMDSRLTSTNLDGLQRYNSDGALEDRRIRVDTWRVQPKAPLNLDLVDANGIKIPPRLEKHDSNESFTFLTSSADSREPSMPASFTSVNSGPNEMVSERPSRPRMVTRMSMTTSPEAQQDSPESNPYYLYGVESQHPMNADYSFKKEPRPNRDGPRREVVSHDLEALTRMNQVSFASVSHANRSSSDGVKAGTSDGLGRLEAPPSPNAKPGRLWLQDSITKPTTLQHATVSAPADLAADLQDNKPHGTGPMNDLLPSDDDVDIEEGKPFSLIEMLRELVVYHTSSQPDAQMLSHLLLMLVPLLPRKHLLPKTEVDHTLAVYTEHFAATGYSAEEIGIVFESSFDHLFKAGVQPLQVESILATYHEQLMSARLFNEAAFLRRLAYPAYPAVYDEAMKDNSISFKCGNCSKPITNGDDKLRCETCSARKAPCPICWSEVSPFTAAMSKKRPTPHNDSANVKPRTRSALYSTCLLCNHSSHAACLRTWFIDAGETDGGCPTESCLCDCVNGLWRLEKAGRAGERRRALQKGRVRSDDWRASESPAAERARGDLAPSQRGGRGRGRGGGSV